MVEWLERLDYGADSRRKVVISKLGKGTRERGRGRMAMCAWGWWREEGRVHSYIFKGMGAHYNT